MFIRKKKLIKMLKEKQLEIRNRNKDIKDDYAEKQDRNALRYWNGYEDGNDNAFNWIIRRLEKQKENKK